MTVNPLVLVVNDDGYRAYGFRFLLRAVSEAGYRVVGVSTLEASSGASKSLSFRYKVSRARVEGVPVYIVEDGTPATAVLHMLYYEDLKPDIVVSGINHGANMGVEDILSSGTVGAVVEAALHGIPGMAFSKYLEKWDPGVGIDDLSSTHASLIQYLVERLLDASSVCERSECLAYNVNFPQTSVPEKLVLTRTAFKTYDNLLIEKQGEFYRLTSHPGFYTNGYDECSDVGSIIGGNISISSVSWLYSHVTGDCTSGDILLRELIINEPPPQLRVKDCWGSRGWP